MAPNLGKLASVEAALSVGIQPALGTPDEDYLITLLAQTSGLVPEFDVATKPAEHGAGVSNTRPTAKRSRTTRTGHLGQGEFNMALYTRALVPLLVGAGFALQTTNNTTHYTHVLTIAPKANQKWLTFLREWGGKEWRGADGKVSQLTIGGNPNDGLTAQGQFTTLSVDEALGTETKTAEKPVELNPALGAISLILDPDGAAIQAAYSGADLAAENISLEVTNPLDTETLRLFQQGRADLPSTGIGVALTVGGIDVDMDVYEAIVNGGVGNTTPSLVTALAAVDYRHDSASNIAGAAVPYSARFQIPYVEIAIDPAGFRANQDETVNWTFNCEMMDDADLLGATEPITITIVNDVAAYMA